MTPFRTLAASALTALAALAPFAAHADAPASYNDWGTYVNAGYTSNGGYYTPSATAHETTTNYSANAAASLVDGKLHASVFTSNDPDLPAYCTVLTCTWGSSASAQVWEKVTITSGKHKPGEVVQWSLSMDGTKTRGRWAWGDGAYADAYFYYGPDPYGWSRPHELALGAKNGVSGSYLMPDDGSPLTLYYYAKLWVSAREGSVADYSNTMAFNWVLPEGATFTSMSGQFMTAAVPEPSTGVLLLAGGALLAAMARRRRPG